jgi:hypothetical protein
MNIQTNDIGHVIQLSIAPVFLLTGVATKLTVLTEPPGAHHRPHPRAARGPLRKGPDPEYTEELQVLYTALAADQLRAHRQHRLRLPDLRGHRLPVPGRHRQPAAGPLHRRHVRAGDVRA